MSIGAAIKAGAAFVELFATDTKLQKGLDAAANKVKGWAGSVLGVGARITGLGAAISAPFLVAAKSWAEGGDSLLEMSQRLGVTVEALSELKAVAATSGAGAEDLEAALRKMQVGLSGAAGGGGAAAGALRRLGLSAADLLKLPVDEQVGALGEGLAAVENPAERAALAVALFGRGGARLLPMLQDGAEGLARMREQVRELGLTSTTEGAEAAGRLQDSLDLLGMVSKKTFNTLGSAAAPTLQWLISLQTNATASVLRFAKAHKDALGAVFIAGLGIMGLGKVVMGVGGALYGLSFALKGIGAAGGLILAVLGALASPLALALIGVAAIGTNIVLSSNAGIAWLQRLAGAFGGLAQVAGQTWSGITDALAAGDLGLAWDIALAGLKVGWLKFQVDMNTTWRDALDNVLIALHKCAAGLGMIWNAALAGMAGLMATWRHRLREIWTMIQADWEDVKITLSDDSDAKKNERFAANARRRNDELARLGREQRKTEEMLAQQRAKDDAAMAAGVDRARAALKAAGGNRVAAAQAELEKAQQALDIAREQAWWERFMAQGEARKGGTVAGLDLAAGKVEVAGTFYGAAVGRMGYAGGVAQQQLRVQEEIRDAVQDMAEQEGGERFQ